MNWRDYWNQDTPIYAGERHKLLHYQLVANDVLRMLPGPDAAVLDHGCGEALFARNVARRCGHLYLCDAAPLVRERLTGRFGGEARITVLAPEDVPGLEEASLDLVVVNSLLQYLSLYELRGLLSVWRARLKPSGRLVIADVVPPDVSPVTDARALLSFAWKGGFLRSAAFGLARTAFSEYRRIREEIGLSQYGEEEMLDILRDAGFDATRAERNMGHNPARMTFVATPA